jgi:hypothetical protein
MPAQPGLRLNELQSIGVDARASERGNDIPSQPGTLERDAFPGLLDPLLGYTVTQILKHGMCVDLHSLAHIKLNGMHDRDGQ